MEKWVGEREAKISAAEVEKLVKRKAKKKEGLKHCKQPNACSVLVASLV